MGRTRNGFGVGVARLLGLTASLLLASPAHAEAIDGSTRSTARQLAYEGVQAYEAGNYDVAADRLERAHQLFKAPSVALWSGKALEKQRKLVEASERYLEATRLPIDDTSEARIQNDAKAEAQAAYDRLTPRIPRLVIQLYGAKAEDVKLSLDGRAVPSAVIGTSLPVDPGHIQVAAESLRRTALADVTMEEGASTKVILRFGATSAGAEVASDSGPAESTSADTDPQKPGPNLVAPVVVMGAGVVMMGIGIAVITSGNTCDDYYYACDNSGKTSAAIALVSIGAGAVIGGVVWTRVKIHQHEKRAASPTAVLSPIPLRGGAGLGVVGTF